MRMLGVVIFATFILSGVASAQAIDTSSAQPSVIRAVAPLFPVPDKGYAVGSVIVEIQISANGSVITAHAVQGHPFLYSASEKAALRWLFATTAVETKVRTTRLTFIFKVLDGRIAEEDLSPLFMPPYQIEVRRMVPIIETREP